MKMELYCTSTTCFQHKCFKFFNTERWKALVNSLSKFLLLLRTKTVYLRITYMLKEQNVELLAASRIAYTLVYFPQRNLSPVIHEQKFSFILKENILTIQIFCSTGVILNFETTKYEPFIKYCRSLFSRTTLLNSASNNIKVHVQTQVLDFQ